MKLRAKGVQFAIVWFTLALTASLGHAQENSTPSSRPPLAQANAQSQTAAQVQAQSAAQRQADASVQEKTRATSQVSAELVKGKLNPATSKPGDQVTVRMKDDVKSDGKVVLKKGSEVTGVVRNVKRVDANQENKREAKGKASSQASAQSMMQVEWLTPAASGAASQQLNFALQSVAYTNPLFAQQKLQESAAADSSFPLPAARPATASRSNGSNQGGGLLGAGGGVVAGATSTVSTATNIGGGAVAGVGAIGGHSATSAGVIGQTSTGLLAAPALLPANSQTAASLQNNFGVSGNQLFMVGHGEAISSGGTASSMDIFSHMSNDAVITSPSRDFEIGSGAQMQFMVSGSSRK